MSRVRSMRACGPSTGPTACALCGPALLAVGVAEGRPRGGFPSTVVRGAWCQALSLPRPPVLRSGQPGFRDPCVPGAVDAGFFAVATLLFVFFGECPKFCDLAKQRRKIVGGVCEVGKDDFSLYFFWRCVVFLIFSFSSATVL